MRPANIRQSSARVNSSATAASLKGKPVVAGLFDTRLIQNVRRFGGRSLFSEYEWHSIVMESTGGGDETMGLGKLFGRWRTCSAVSQFCTADLRPRRPEQDGRAPSVLFLEL